MTRLDYDGHGVSLTRWYRFVADTTLADWPSITVHAAPALSRQLTQGMPYGASGLTVTAPPAGPLLAVGDALLDVGGELLAVGVALAPVPPTEADADWPLAAREARPDALAGAWLAGFGAG
jgi:hypothetical protein